MLKKATAAALFMTILPVGMTFAAEPVTPQNNPEKQALTSDICEELVSLNDGIIALAQDNEKNISNLKTYLKNNQKIQKMRDELKIDQDSIQCHINLVQPLFSHLVEDKLKITEDNSEIIKELEKNIETRYTKFSRHYNSMREPLQSDLRSAREINTFNLNNTPISFKYIDYQKVSFFIIVEELFFLNNVTDLRISINPEIDTDDVKDCLKTIHSYQKNILIHLDALAKIEAINSTHLEATKNIMGMNIKTIDEYQDTVKTLMGLK